MVTQWVLAPGFTWDLLEAVAVMSHGSIKDLGHYSGTRESISETRSKDGPSA